MPSLRVRHRLMKQLQLGRRSSCWSKTASVALTQFVKRTSASVTHGGKTYFCSKGMVDVILKTDPADEGLHQWQVDNYQEMAQTVTGADAQMGMSGFKKLGVCVC